MEPGGSTGFRWALFCHVVAPFLLGPRRDPVGSAPTSGRVGTGGRGPGEPQPLSPGRLEAPEWPVPEEVLLGTAREVAWGPQSLATCDLPRAWAVEGG